MKKQELYTQEELVKFLEAKAIVKANKVAYLRDIIKYETGFEVIPMNDSLYNLLDSLCKDFISQFNQDNTQKTHSKFGWLVENKFREFCRFESPKGSGYPDCQIPTSMFELSPFVENKTYSADSLDSSLRTFYYNSNNKITRSTNHILVGFEFGDSKKGKYLTGRYHIVDMYNKRMSFRSEINCNNKELYD